MSSLVAFALTLCLVAGFALPVAAQDIWIPLKITTKTVRQGTSGLEQKALKSTISNKTLFELCTPLSPASEIGFFLVTECDGNFDATVIAADITDPMSPDVIVVGSLDFDQANTKVTTKQQGLTVLSRTHPFTFAFDCGGAAEFVAQGIGQVTYKQIEGDLCPSTIKGKFTGVGDMNPIGDVLIDAGSSFTASGKPFFP